ncbi:unnamed protein product, partial [Microthlaspi erraticum]
MGNASGCCAGTAAGEISSRYDVGVGLVHDNLGHSFCYVGPILTASKSSFPPEPSLRPDPIPETTTTYRSISGASVSANTSTALSASPSTDASLLASGFESSNRFASLPLQPVPRGPVKKAGHGPGLFERRFLSGPIESGLVSGGKEKKETKKQKKLKSFSKPKSKKKSLTFKTVFTNLISNNLSRSKKSVVEPINSSDSSDSDQNAADDHRREVNLSSKNPSSHENPRTEEEEEKSESASEEPKIQWAQGKAGEDRVHVILSEENGWLFVGIYDGFSGPDPPDFLLNNLYTAVLKELKGLLWNDKHSPVEDDSDSGEENCHVMKGENVVACGSRNITSS